MKEEMRILLSAYLDGHVTPAERRTVETLLQQDAATREELEALRQWSQDISASAPPTVQAPSGFRQKIMQRLESSAGDLPPANPGVGGLGPWLLTGTVLVGLVGGLMYLDYTKNRAQVSSPAGAQTDKSRAIARGRGMSESQPAYRGQTNQLQNETNALSSDILGRSAIRNRGEAISLSPITLGGDVFVSGRAHTKRKKGSGPLPKLPAVDYTAGTRGEAALANRLEDFQNWTRTDVQVLYRQSGRQPVSPAGDILRWAKQYRLNPGLIVAATLVQESFEPTVILPKIRRVLDATAGQLEPQRLRRVIEVLAGPGTSPKAWETFLTRPDSY